MIWRHRVGVRKGRTREKSSFLKDWLRVILHSKKIIQAILSRKQHYSPSGPVKPPSELSVEQTNNYSTLFSSFKNTVKAIFSFESLASDKKTIPELISSFFHKTYKALAKYFNLLKSQYPEKKIYEIKSKLFSVGENFFNVTSSVFNWARFGLKIHKIAGSDSKLSKAEALSKVDALAFTVSQIPFLVMQSVQNVWNFLTSVVKGLEDSFKVFFGNKDNYKRYMGFYTAVSYIGIHVIDFVHKIFELARANRESLRRKHFKELVKLGIIFGLSLTITVIAFIATRADISHFATYKNSRDLLLSIMTLLEAIFKHFSYPLGWFRDRCFDLWGFITGRPVERRSVKSKQHLKEQDQEEVKKEMTFLKSFRKVVKKLKVWGVKFRNDQIKSLKMEKISPLSVNREETNDKEEIKSLDVVFFILNLASIIGGLISTSLEATAVVPFSAISLVTISGLIFLFNAILLIDNLIKYNDPKYDSQRDELLNKMLGQGIKMGLCLAVIALSFIFSGPAIAVAAVVASALFYGYLILNWICSNKTQNRFVLMGNREKDLDDEAVVGEGCFYLYSIGNQLKCKLREGNKIKVIYFNELSKEEDEEIKNILASSVENNVLCSDLSEALFKETAKKGYFEFVIKETWTSWISSALTLKTSKQKTEIKQEYPKVPLSRTRFSLFNTNSRHETEMEETKKVVIEDAPPIKVSTAPSSLFTGSNKINQVPFGEKTTSSNQARCSTI